MEAHPPCVHRSAVTAAQTSDDGGTTKMLLSLQDGLQVEAVIITYDSTDARSHGGGGGEEEAASSSGNAKPSRAAAATGRTRSTLCVSSQVGCQMGCTFCSTGTMGLKGDLTAGEILEQLVHARRLAEIRNVVFMVRSEEGRDE